MEIIKLGDLKENFSADQSFFTEDNYYYIGSDESGQEFLCFSCSISDYPIQDRCSFRDISEHIRKSNISLEGVLYTPDYKLALEQFITSMRDDVQKNAPIPKVGINFDDLDISKLEYQSISDVTLEGISFTTYISDNEDVSHRFLLETMDFKNPLAPEPPLAFLSEADCIWYLISQLNRHKETLSDATLPPKELLGQSVLYPATTDTSNMEALFMLLDPDTLPPSGRSPETQIVVVLWDDIGLMKDIDFTSISFQGTNLDGKLVSYEDISCLGVVNPEKLSDELKDKADHTRVYTIGEFGFYRKKFMKDFLVLLNSNKSLEASGLWLDIILTLTHHLAMKTRYEEDRFYLALQKRYTAKEMHSIYQLLSYVKLAYVEKKEQDFLGFVANKLGLPTEFYDNDYVSYELVKRSAYIPSLTDLVDLDANGQVGILDATCGTGGRFIARYYCLTHLLQEKVSQARYEELFPEISFSLADDNLYSALITFIQLNLAEVKGDVTVLTEASILGILDTEEPSRNTDFDFDFLLNKYLPL